MTKEIINISQLASQDFDENCTADLEQSTYGTNEFSHICDNLYQGSLPGDPKSLHKTFSFVFNLSEIQYQVPRGVTLTHWYIDDCPRLPNLDKVHAIASMVTAARQIGPTLVHCAAGLNRSGLISALSLIQGGLRPIDAVKLLRDKRTSAVLCNQSFYSYVLSRTKGESPVIILPNKAERF